MRGGLPVSVMLSNSGALFIDDLLAKGKTLVADVHPARADGQVARLALSLTAE